MLRSRAQRVLEKSGGLESGGFGSGMRFPNGRAVAAGTVENWEGRFSDGQSARTGRAEQSYMSF